MKTTLVYRNTVEGSESIEGFKGSPQAAKDLATELEARTGLRYMTRTIESEPEWLTRGECGHVYIGGNGRFYSVDACNLPAGHAGIHSHGRRVGS